MSSVRSVFSSVSKLLEAFAAKGHRRRPMLGVRSVSRRAAPLAVDAPATPLKRSCSCPFVRPFVSVFSPVSKLLTPARHRDHRSSENPCASSCYSSSPQPPSTRNGRPRGTTTAPAAPPTGQPSTPHTPPATATNNPPSTSAPRRRKLTSSLCVSNTTASLSKASPTTAKPSASTITTPSTLSSSAPTDITSPNSTSTTPPRTSSTASSTTWSSTSCTRRPTASRSASPSSSRPANRTQRSNASSTTCRKQRRHRRRHPRHRPRSPHALTEKPRLLYVRRLHHRAALHRRRHLVRAQNSDRRSRPSQIAAFAKRYPNDVRPVQPLNGRIIKSTP